MGWHARRRVGVGRRVNDNDLVDMLPLSGDLMEPMASNSSASIFLPIPRMTLYIYIYILLKPFLFSFTK